MIPVDGDTMRAIAPHVSGKRAAAQAAIIDAVGGVLAQTLAGFQIDTRLRIAHFLAQICHESDGFCTTQEYASGAAYEGRKDLGNTHPGDGPRFKGRGLLQLTGRANYGIYGTALGMDLVNAPETAAEPHTSLRVACAYWKLHAINPKCDADDLYAVTRAVNGGTNGIDSRRACLSLAKAAVASLEAVAASVAGGGAAPVLRRGSASSSVADLQRELRALGEPIVVDGAYGPATELAVNHFQARHGLPVTGIVDAATRGALATA